MAARNFGQIVGPFEAGQNVLLKIQQQENNNVNVLVKLGISYVGDFDLDIYGKYISEQYILINNIDFQLGKTRILEQERDFSKELTELKDESLVNILKEWRHQISP